MNRRCAVILALLAAASLARATPAAAGVFVLDEPSADVSPYSFIQLLPRGASHTMYAYHLGVWEDGYTHDHETFLRYELPEDLLLSEETVVQASLIMVYAFSFSHWPDELPPDEVPVTLEVREVLAPWVEAQLTWANQPAAGPPVDVVAGIPYDAYGPVELDVTGLVRAWAEGQRPNHGFKITNPAVRPVGFWTKEAFRDFAAAGLPLDPALRSVLVVVTEVPEPGALATGLAAAGALAVAAAGRRTSHRARTRHGAR